MDNIRCLANQIRTWCYEGLPSKWTVEDFPKTALVMVPYFGWGNIVMDGLLWDRAFRRRKTNYEMVFRPNATMIWFAVEGRSICGRQVDKVFIHSECSYGAYAAAIPCEIPRRAHARIRNR